MFCLACGHKNPAGVNFCSSCGAPLAASNEATVAFLPDDPSGEFRADEPGLALSDLAPGVGVLVVKHGPEAGTRYVLDAQVTRVGRHPDSEIFLDDITVSRRHAEFAGAHGAYQVHDVGSLNGTYVNRERIEEVELRDGDEVQIGKFKLLFLTAGS